MKPARRKLALIAYTLLLSILACNMPRPGSPTPFALTTPDLTLTAVFNPDVNSLPTATFPLPGTPVNTPTSPPISSASPTILPATATETAPPTAVPIQASPTPIPATATTIPTQKPASSEGPGARQNTTLTGLYMNTEPEIDGDFDEWNQEYYPVNSLVYGENNWSGENDLSGNIMVAWDEAYLYIAVRVKDDLYVQNATGESLFEGDSIELLFDGNVAKDFYVDSLNEDDYQLGISPGRGTLNNYPENYLWYPQAAEGFYRKVKASAIPVDDGYRLEIKVPWNILGATPTGGQHYGFAFSISDNDDPNRNIQQSMVSNVSTRVLTDPTTWGDLTVIR